jgi:hypothetical protein
MADNEAIMLIDNNIYYVLNNQVYEYDLLTEEHGAYVGTLVDGQIVPPAPEPPAA